MCRSLYVLEHGRIASKPEALQWAMTALEKKWIGFIEAAAVWREGMEFDRLEETLEFICYTRERSRVIGNGGKI